MKPKRGRPPRVCEVTGRRTGVSHRGVNLTDREWRHIKNQAEKAGVSASVYVARITAPKK